MAAMTHSLTSTLVVAVAQPAVSGRQRAENRACMLRWRAVAGKGQGSTGGVAVLAGEGDATEGVGSVATKARKSSPLQKGGTLGGQAAEGKDPAPATLGKASPIAAFVEGKFDDPRWQSGTWDVKKFTKDGKVDWDAVIDAGMSNFETPSCLFLWFVVL